MRWGEEEKDAALDERHKCLFAEVQSSPWKLQV